MEYHLASPLLFHNLEIGTYFQRLNDTTIITSHGRITLPSPEGKASYLTAAAQIECTNKILHGIFIAGYCN